MSTHTTSSSFTITHARYVTSKVAADLRQLRGLYGKGPDDDEIARYAEEAALLLRDGYLERVDYGFKRNTSSGSTEWMLLLRYTARAGQLSDDHAGRVPAGVPISDAYFHSFLSYTGKFMSLSASERQRIKEVLPVSRTGGDESRFATGTWGNDRGYSSSDQGVARSVFRAL